jgi:outer membrane biosynthesis protein TonB
MRSSTLITMLGATLAVATPLAHDRLHKKAIIYEVETDIVYVTVTAGQEPAAEPTTVKVINTVVVSPEPETTTHHVHSKKPKTSSTSIASPPPAPTTSISTPPPAPTTEAPAPAPTTTEAAPVVVVTPTTQAPVAASTPETAKAVTPAASTPSDPLAGTGIDKHNTCRSSHSAQEVTWNATLADAASKLANSCVWGHDL